MKRTRTKLVERRFHSTVTGMALPFLDGHLIAIDSAASWADWNFTIRHELAHVLAGDLSGLMFLTRRTRFHIPSA